MNDIKPMNSFDSLKIPKDEEIKDISPPKTIFDKLNQENSFQPSPYLKRNSPFNTFDPFNTNNQDLGMSTPRIIITRFSKPSFENKYEDDSLDEDSERGYLSYKDQSNKSKRSKRRKQRNRRHRNGQPIKPEVPSFMQRMRNSLANISLTKVFIFSLFSAFFILVGYALRKNEEESNYVRLAPQ